jgi:hypothetical protein
MSQPPEPDTPGPAPELPESETNRSPPDLDEFSQRLASFGLGEGPDLLLTPTPPRTRGPRKRS